MRQDCAIIGIGQRAQQGKTTFAKFLANSAVADGMHFGDVEIYNIGDLILAHARMVGLCLHKNPVTLQTLGVLYRHVNPDWWLNQLELKITDGNPMVVIVTGIRFPNEIEWVRRAQHHALIKVERLRADGAIYVSPDRPKDHLTETALDKFEDWTYTVKVKDGDLTTLEVDAINMWDILKRRFLP